MHVSVWNKFCILPIPFALGKGLGFFVTSKYGGAFPLPAVFRGNGLKVGRTCRSPFQFFPDPEPKTHPPKIKKRKWIQESEKGKDLLEIKKIQVLEVLVSQFSHKNLSI